MPHAFVICWQDLVGSIGIAACLMFLSKFLRFLAKKTTSCLKQKKRWKKKSFGFCQIYVCCKQSVFTLVSFSL